MNSLRSIRPIALALGLGTATLAGCATTSGDLKTTNNVEARQYSTLEDAMRILGVNNASWIAHLPNGYLTTKNLADRVRIIAGVYAGTIKVQRVGDGYRAEGTYSQVEHPEALERVLKEVDKNGDKVITVQEVVDLQRRVYQQYTQ